MAERHSRGSSSALSSVSDDDGLPPSSPSHSTVSENDDSTLEPAMPPAKKRKTNARAARPVSPARGDTPNYDLADVSDISSDTSGSVPPSPRPHPAGQPATVDEPGLASEQVRVCAWDGCDAGDMGDQDQLIRHINDVHVGQKGPKAKYPCEWTDCKAKGKQHGSAYSLRNHMKSHTKERAHYCSLPECDRSFTRSDALHKHMRTVHESESFRTAEHYPKQKPSQPAPNAAAPTSPTPVTSPRPPTSAGGPTTNGDDGTPKSGVPTKITLKLGGSKDETKEPLSPRSRAEICSVTVEDRFSPEEAAMPRDQLLKLLRRQIKWAEEEGKTLEKEVSEAEALRRQEWLDKELLVENLLESELMNGLKKGTMKNEVWLDGNRIQLDDEDLDAAAKLPIHGNKLPWYREAQYLRSSNTVRKVVDGPALTHESAGDAPTKSDYGRRPSVVSNGIGPDLEDEDDDEDDDMDQDD